MINSLYREEILEHYKNPLNFCHLKKFDISSKQLNPFCGDEIEMFIKFAGLPPGVNENHLEGVIEDIGFWGRGCAISIASASILTEYIKGKNRQRLEKFSEKNMMKLLSIEVSQARKKCALLAWSALRDCVV